MLFDSNIGSSVTNCRSTVLLSPARSSRESKINKLTTVFIDRCKLNFNIRHCKDYVLSYKCLIIQAVIMPFSK